MAKKARPSKQYPDARPTGMKGIFQMLQEEKDWMPNEITVKALKTLDLARGKETNAIFALKFLGVLDKDKKPTEEFANLRNSFQPTLIRLVKAAYRELFNIIPLSRMTQHTLVKYFMESGYCEDTAEYQAKLFAWLCEQANIELPNIESSFKRARFQKGKQ